MLKIRIALFAVGGVVSLLAGAVLSWAASRVPSDFGWFAYSPYRDQVFYPESQVSLGLLATASLTPLMVSVACLTSLAVGERLVRFHAVVVGISGGAAILGGVAAFLGRGGSWEIGWGAVDRGYADYLVETGPTISLVIIASLLLVVCGLLMLTSLLVVVIGVRRSRAQ